MTMRNGWHRCEIGQLPVPEATRASPSSTSQLQRFGVIAGQGRPRTSLRLPCGAVVLESVHCTARVVRPLLHGSALHGQPRGWRAVCAAPHHKGSITQEKKCTTEFEFS